MVAGHRYFYRSRVASYAQGSALLQVAVRIANAATVATAQGADPALAAASPSVWKLVTPAAMTAHSVRERQRMQITETIQYETQYFTIVNAVAGTFRLQFADNVAVRAPPCLSRVSKLRVHIVGRARPC